MQTCLKEVYLYFSAVDLIVEVAHVSITLQFGERFLEKADFMVSVKSFLILSDALMQPLTLFFM